MRFRPCIDIHNGKVKQIVGSSLADGGDFAEENYTARQGAAWFARFYHEDGLTGGHMILLNPVSSPQYRATHAEALDALKAVPGFLQLGGGVTPYNAAEYLDAGASAVIVTSYVFQDGHFNERHLNKMVEAVGRERLVLDLSCRRKPEGGDGYFIVTDRWQKFTEVELTAEMLRELSGSCAEFLVHAVDVEGRRMGPELTLVDLLKDAPIPVTYAGGIRSFEDLDRLRERGEDRVDFSIGSALDLFGGDMPYERVKGY